MLVVALVALEVLWMGALGVVVEEVDLRVHPNFEGEETLEEVEEIWAFHPLEAPMMKAVVVDHLVQYSLETCQVSVEEEGQVVEGRIRFRVVEALGALVALAAYCEEGVAFQDGAFLGEEAYLAFQAVRVVVAVVNRDAFHPSLQAQMIALA